MQLATWNVNSLKVRLPRWTAGRQPVDVLCLQSSKEDHACWKPPCAAGYCAEFAGQKTYNGVGDCLPRHADRH